MRLVEHAAAHGWHGPDPYDGLWAPWPPPLVAGRRRRQLIVQLHARSPVDIRRVYRRRHPRIAKALALFGAAALRAHARTADARARALALDALGPLMEDRSSGARAWGYPFDVQTRWSFYAAGAPNVVVTSFAAGALLEAGNALDRGEFLDRARDAARWVLEELWIEPEGFFAYHPSSRVNVHNANLLGAALVHAALRDDPLARERVARATERSLDAQRRDGSWRYGEGPGLEWVDSFHTGYVLSSLRELRSVDPRVAGAIERGANRYGEFFDEAGRAKLWAGRPFPEDAHSAGTGLSTLSGLVRDGVADPDLVQRVAHRVLTVGLRGDRVIARRYRWGRTTVWYPRWCDGHVAMGLADAAAVVD